MIKAVIFDMDGVIADTIPAHFLSWQKLFKEEFDIKLSKKYFLKNLNARQGPDTIKLVTGLKLSYKKRLALTELKNNHSQEILQKSLKPTKGLISFLKFLKQNNIKTAIATSAQPKIKNIFIKKLKINKYFNYTITAKDVAKSKPHPQCFLKAAKALDTKPNEAMVIEDALMGVVAAKAGKFNKVVAITSSHKRKELKKADYIINDFNDENLRKIIVPEIILASKSMVRKILLAKKNKKFKVVISNIDEKKTTIKDPKKLVFKLAELKAKKVFKNNKTAIIIGTDTVGALNNKIYGKPKTKKKYFEFVREHSQQKLAVITGWYIIDGANNKVYSGVETSWVYFNKITKNMAENYFNKYNPLEKGGGFNIEEIEKLGFVKKIKGNYNNIIGLPDKTVKKLLTICDN